MLRSINDLRGLSIRATDGEIGHVDEFLFDDADWSVRYMVANTGGWLSPATVLISPRSIRVVDWEERLVAVNLTRQQVVDVDITRATIKGEPAYDPAQLNRAYEQRLYQHFRQPSYWNEALTKP